MLHYKTTLWCVLLIGMIFRLCPAPVHAAPLPQEGDEATLRVINESEETICYVLISPVTSDEWGDNWLEREETIALEANRDFDVASGDYDVRMLDCDGSVLLDERGLAIKGQYELRFASTTATLRVINESEERICRVFISPITSDSWGRDWLNGQKPIRPGANRDFNVVSGYYDVLLGDCKGNVLLDERGVTITDEYELRLTGPAAPLPQEGEEATLRVINESEETICSVAVCSLTAEGWDDCAVVAETTISPGESETFTVTSGDYNVFLLDCEFNVFLEERGLTITGQYELRLAGSDVCKALNEEGMAFSRHRYHDALQKFQEALACYRDTDDRHGEGTALNNIGTVYASLGEYAKALDYYEQSLAIRREIGDRRGIGESLNNIGFIYERLGEYAEALDYTQQALTILRETGDRAGEGSSLNGIGNIYDHFGEHEEALATYEQALTICREIGDRAGEGISLYNIGLIYERLGEYAEALDYTQQALTILRETGDRAEEGDSLNTIGFIYARLGDYAEALAYSEQALTIHRELGDRAGEGIALNTTGLIYERLGDYALALDYSQQALTIRREIGDRAGEGESLNNIGGIYDSLGEYAAALAHLEQSLTICRAIGDRVGEGGSLNNIGGVYASLGDYAEALDYYEQALTTQREIDNRAGEGRILANIGLIYDSLGEYAAALDYHEQSLTIFREIGDRAGEGVSLNNIGGIYDSLGQYAEALDYYQQALAILREIGDRAGEGQSLVSIGLIYDSLGEYAAALDYHEQSLTIFREIGDRAGEGVTLNNIGGIYDSLGEYAAALDTYEQALTVLEAVRATAGSEAGRAGFIAQYASLYDRAVNLYHAQGQAAAAFHTSERGRARAFLDTMATGHVQLSDTAADLYAREVTAYTARQAIQHALIQARAQSAPDDTLISDLEAQLAQAEAEHAAALDAIAARGDQLAALVPGRSAVLDLPQVQARLDENTTLISYWVTDDQTLAFVVTADSLDAVTLPISHTALITQVNGFRDFANLYSAHPENAVALYHALIAPLHDLLTTPHLVIIPHNVLHYLPFAALTDGARYLLDDYTLSYLPNASILQYLPPSVPPTGGEVAGGQTLLILGNPTTGEYDSTASFATERDGLGALPFAEREAQAIAALYGATPLIREAAAESRVHQQAGATRILHLAAHGKYNPVAPLHSLIALAPEGEHDGWLTVGEVYGLDLRQADLVVLSACQSHLGDLSAGDELVGLTRAFFFAGTPTVVASLWSVEDQATAELMEHFYTHLRAGMGKAEALRQAQLDTRAAYPNPYYWSAFVLSGDAGEVTAAPAETPTPSPDTPAGGGLCASAAFPLALLALAWVWRTSTR